MECFVEAHTGMSPLEQYARLLHQEKADSHLINFDGLSKSLNFPQDFVHFAGVRSVFVLWDSALVISAIEFAACYAATLGVS